MHLSCLVRAVTIATFAVITTITRRTTTIVLPDLPSDTVTIVVTV